MKHNPKFIYPTSSRSLINEERHYDIDAEKLPSVTTILQATQPEEKRAALAAWKARVGEAEACLLYTSPSPRDRQKSRMPSSA